MLICKHFINYLCISSRLRSRHINNKHKYKLSTLGHLTASLSSSRYQIRNFTISYRQFKMTEQTSVAELFLGAMDRYKGVHVRSSKEPCDAASFVNKLEASLKHWMSQEVRSVWFIVGSDHADWVPVLANNSFRFHHTTRQDEVAMVRWLASEESRIPVYSHTMIGAGAVVINKEGKILVVQERYQNMPYWKLPGGYVEPGEDIPQAAIREVMEETNIKTEFKSMIAFRHSHGAPFGCSDIYFIVELAPLTTDIVKDQLEIEDCQWMEIETYLNHPNVHENNRLFVRKYLFSKDTGISISGTKTLHPVTKAPQMLFALEKNEK